MNGLTELTKHILADNKNDRIQSKLCK